MVALRCFRTRGVMIMAIAFAVGANAQSANNASQLSPARSLSLKTCGWEPEPVVVHHSGYVPSTVAFDHQGNFWTGYTKKTQQLASRSAPEVGAEYNLVEVSGNSTECVVRIKLPTTESSPVAALISNKDNLLAVANDKLHEIDPQTFKERSAFDLLRPSDHARYQVLQSPQRKSLVVVEDGFTRTESSYTWLNPESLQVLQTCTYPPEPDHYVRLRAFADDGRFIEVEHGPGTLGHWVSEGRYCSPKQHIPPERIQPSAAILLDDQNVYFRENPLNDNQPSIVAYSRTGTLLQSVPARDKETMATTSGVAISENGTRAALVVNVMSGGVRWLDVSNHVSARRVDIYDTKTWSRIAQIKLSSPGEVELAFSPDGKTLAVQTNDLIQFFDALP